MVAPYFSETGEPPIQHASGGANIGREQSGLDHPSPVMEAGDSNILALSRHFPPRSRHEYYWRRNSQDHHRIQLSR